MNGGPHPALGPDTVPTLLVEILQRVTAIETHGKVIIDEQKHAREHRTEIWRRINQVGEDAAIARRIAPIVDTHEKHFQQMVGAGKFGAVIGKLAHAISAVIGGLLVWALQHYFGGASK